MEIGKRACGCSLILLYTWYFGPRQSPHTAPPGCFGPRTTRTRKRREKARYPVEGHAHGPPPSMIHPWTRTRPIWWPAPRLCLSRKEYMPVASGYCRCPLSVGTLAAGRRPPPPPFGSVCHRSAGSGGQQYTRRHTQRVRNDARELEHCHGLHALRRCVPTEY